MPIFGFDSCRDELLHSVSSRLLLPTHWRLESDPVFQRYIFGGGWSLGGVPSL